MLYSKNGSIPKPETDGTEGWVEVQEPPVAPDGGYEVIWWSPPGWVIRPNKPIKDGFDYSWSQSEEKWVEYELPVTTSDIVLDVPAVDLSSGTESISVATASDTVITLDVGAAQEVITLASAEPTITITGE